MDKRRRLQRSQRAGNAAPRTRSAEVQSRRRARIAGWSALLGVILAITAVAGFIILQRSSPANPVRWVALGTDDVHSLAFVDEDAQHLVFGHHAGLDESRDGGRTWSSLPIANDAMSTSAAADGSIVIAGHSVFEASRDNGRTWAPIASDLPSLDVHGFTRDPGDPARMWVYLATGGLWESVDFGAHFSQVRADNVIYPVAVRDNLAGRLFGVDASGFVGSSDGGRTWAHLSRPPFTPVTALAATADGRVIYGGSPSGLFKSVDGGQTWSSTGYGGSAFAIATVGGGDTVAVVSQQRDYFRSDNAGMTWPGPP